MGQDPVRSTAAPPSPTPSSTADAIRRGLEEAHGLPLSPFNAARDAQSSAVSTMHELLDWRIRDRIKTVAAGLCLCLHLGIDPPDVSKPQPCARWECWIDPAGGLVRRTGEDTPPAKDTAHAHAPAHAQPPPDAPPASPHPSHAGALSSVEKVREAIARSLQTQYEQWQPRVRFKTLLDPTVEDVRKMCLSLRKSARLERILFHYNGHGVPRPTRNGELWVFNKQFTQYIPLNAVDICAWLGLPAVWVLDCAHAQHITQVLVKIAEDELPLLPPAVSFSTASVTSSPACSAAPDAPTRDLVVFAASGCDELLPFVPQMPADLLTSCLTTPLESAIRWHCYVDGSLLAASSIDDALRIPGRASDRRTPLGELNWIFTAITDTMAWLVLSRARFRRLFRQDLLVASLARNFLLAQRILKSFYCTAHMHPALPPTHLHPLWTVWDHVLDAFLAQQAQHRAAPAAEHRPSTFFTDQLDALELWLRQHAATPPAHINGPPDQLPAALQILLSQNLRPRALQLLARFCDLGPWACLECLHVGIHPYILKLLQTAAPQPLAAPHVSLPLLHIWTRLISTDPDCCRFDLMKDPSAHLFFCNCLASTDPPMATETAAALVSFVHDNDEGLRLVLEAPPVLDWLAAFPRRPALPDAWAILLLGKLWHGQDATDALVDLLGTPLSPLMLPLLGAASFLTRAAAVFALGNLICDGMDERLLAEVVELLLGRIADCSSHVRLELVVAFSRIIAARFAFLPEEAGLDALHHDHQLVLKLVLKAVMALCLDPHRTVAVVAGRLLDQVRVLRSTAPNDRSIVFAASVPPSAPPNCLKSSLPIPSCFIDYCIRSHLPRFLEKPADPHPPTQPTGLSASLGRQRAKAHFQSAIDLDLNAWPGRTPTARKFDHQVNIFDSGSSSDAAAISTIALHPLLDLVFVADLDGCVTAWDWRDGTSGKRLYVSPSSALISTLSFLPFLHNHLLLTAAECGAIRLYQTLGQLSPMPCLAFQIKSPPCPSPVVAHWAPNTAKIIAVTADALHFFDPHACCIAQAPIPLSDTAEFGDESNVVSFLDSSTDTVYCAHAHSISVFDGRQAHRRAVIKAANCCNSEPRHLWQLASANHLAVGCVDGSISIWDVRMSGRLQTLDHFPFITPGMPCMANHALLPNLVACASSDQYIKFGELSEFFTDSAGPDAPASTSNPPIATLHTLRYHEGFLGQRLGQIKALAFHPERLLFAAAANETVISLYTTSKKD